MRLGVIVFCIIGFYLKILYSIFIQNVYESAGSPKENFFVYRDAQHLNYTDLDMPNYIDNDKNVLNKLTGDKIRNLAKLIKNNMIDKLIGLNSSLTSDDIDKFWTFENKDLGAELIT